MNCDLFQINILEFFWGNPSITPVGKTGASAEIRALYFANVDQLRHSVSPVSS